MARTPKYYHHGRSPAAWTGSVIAAIGFVVAFLVALMVIRVFVAFVSKSGFAPFAWYRIAFGIVVLLTWQFDLVQWTVS